MINLANIIVVSFFSFLFYSSEIDDEKAKEYIELYKHIAVSEMDRSGIPASIKMAQAILESGVGESELAIHAKNHFGMKCGGEVWTGPTYYMWDDEKDKSCFRVYSTAEESYIAHSEFLLNPKKSFRYGFLFELDPRDYKAWAIGLQESGYATSKTYSKNLIALIERFELYKLDYLTTELMAVNNGELAEIFPSLIPEPELADSDTSTSVTTIANPYGIDSIDLVLTLFVFKVNNLDAVYVQPEDDIHSIADRYRQKPAKLIRINELKNRVLKTGQYVFLKPKKNYFKSSNTEKDTRIHIVDRNESIYDIAQQYGVKLRKLKCLNKKVLKAGIKAGMQIKLRKN